ncbi:unnamed protein product [Caenorhabditis nigoni]
MLKPDSSITEKDQSEINTAYRIKEQKVFQLKMRSEKWENLDLSDPFTRNFIIEIDADESKLQKFNDDIFRNQLDPRIKFLSVAAQFVGNASQPPIAHPQTPQNHQVAAPSNFMTSNNCSMPNPQNCLIPQQNNRMVPPPKNSMPPQNFLMPQLQNSIMPPAQNWSMPPSQNSSMPTLQNSPTQPQNNKMVPPNSSWTSQNIQIPPGNVSMSAKMPQLAPSNFHASATPFLMQNQNFPMPFQQNSISSPFNHKVFPNSEPMNSSMTSQNVSVAPPRNPTVPHQNLPIPLQVSHMEPRNISMDLQNYQPPAQNISMMPQKKIMEPSPMALFYFKGSPPNIQAPPGFPPISSRTFQGPPPSIQGPGGYWPTPPQIVQGPPPSGFLPNLSRIAQGPATNFHGPPLYFQSHTRFPHPPSNWPTRPQNFQEQSRSIQIPPGFGPIPPQRFNGPPQNYQNAPTKCQILPPCRLMSIQNIQKGVYCKSATNTNMMIRQNSQKGYRNNGKRYGPPKNQNHGNGNGRQSMGRSIPVGEVSTSNLKSNVNDLTNINTTLTRGKTSNDTVLKCNNGDVTANLMDTEKAKNPNQQEILNEEEGFLAVPVLQEPVGVPSICERHDAKTESAPIPLEVVSTRSDETRARNPDNLAQLPISTEVSFPVETTVDITESEHEPKSILTPEADKPTLPKGETVEDNVPIPITPATFSESDAFQNTPQNFHTKPTAADKGVMGKKEHAKPGISSCKGKKNNGRNAPSSSTKPTMAPGGSPAKPDISLQIEKESEKIEPKKVITAIIINAPASKTESSEQNDVNSSETFKREQEDEPSFSLQPKENNGNKKNKKAKKTKSGKETIVEEDFDQLLKRFQLEDQKNKISDGESKSAPEKPKRRTIKQYRQEKAKAEAEAAKAAYPTKPEFESLEGLDEFEDLDGEYCVVTDIQNIHYPTDLPLIPEEVVNKVQEQLKEFVEDVKDCIREGQRLPYWPDLDFKLEDSLDLETCSQEIIDFFSKKFVDLRRVDTPWAQFRRLFYSELVRDFVSQLWPVIAVFLEEEKSGTLNFPRELSIISKICNPKEHKNLYHITYFSF